MRADRSLAPRDGSELTAASGPWFRFDRQSPPGWSWDPFPTPRHRFDSVSGSHRLRYGSTRFVGAARGRSTGRIVAVSDHDHWMVELTGTLQVVELVGSNGFHLEGFLNS